MTKVVAIKRHYGSPVAVKFEDDTVMSYDEFFEKVLRCEIGGYSAYLSHNGTKTVKTLPDAVTSNNLSELPSF